MKSNRETIKWLVKSFSLFSIIKIFLYYTKKKFGRLDYQKTFKIKFSFRGKRIIFKLRENNDDFAIIREIFLYGAYRIGESNLEKVSNILDFGSHIGGSAIYFNCVFPGVKLYCFEPDKESRCLLLENLGMNNIDSSVFNFAISDKKRLVPFISNLKNPAFSRISKNGKIEVHSVSIEDIITLLNLKSFDIIKMDVEGEEIKVLQGLNRSAKKIKLFICEVHYEKISMRILKDLFNKKGFFLQKPLPHWKNLNKDIEYPLMIAINKDILKK